MKKTSYMHRFKFLLFVVVLIFSKQIVKAQSQDAAVRASVDKLFDGMRSGDSSTVRSVFIPQSTLTSVSTNAKDSVMTHVSKTDDFVAAIGKPHTEKWDERIYDVKISVDGPMAIVWAPYKFYRGDTFSHCGVNVFTMIKTKNGWKINTITDTRRKTNCL
ncbi:nuclear transport factor 2 family protein [Dyadobacter sp. CY356]|uniref:nuclear transport factor 2 family protein n=1 Tax=Dyadobacter sp. CY356 TaxID=2906442 RepID=UPI001F25D5AC|nr:nuclear transport factor 2 family protein [Dyadobacter sp. CY356]MCF0057727.1 nuclear transport factor 2 family protein [Dyadobacter sp. CY356]